MVLAMYNQQLDTMEANRPDTYVVPPAVNLNNAPKPDNRPKLGTS
jgi:hypothetical protein